MAVDAIPSTLKATMSLLGYAAVECDFENFFIVTMKAQESSIGRQRMLDIIRQAMVYPARELDFYLTQVPTTLLSGLDMFCADFDLVGWSRAFVAGVTQTIQAALAQPANAHREARTHTVLIANTGFCSYPYHTKPTHIAAADVALARVDRVLSVIPRYTGAGSHGGRAYTFIGTTSTPLFRPSRSSLLPCKEICCSMRLTRWPSWRNPLSLFVPTADALPAVARKSSSALYQPRAIPWSATSCKHSRSRLTTP
eukprot:349672-Pleurochrysis_carterae.AAC.1